MATLTQTTDTINLENDPKIEGITFRKFRGEEDFPAMVRIYNEASKADGVNDFSTVEGVTNTYAHLNRFDPSKDMIFVESFGEAVGYGRCGWSKELAGNYLYAFFINLLPDYRHTSILDAMVDFMFCRLLTIADQHPADAPKFFQTWGTYGLKWHEDLMDKLGMQPNRYSFEMHRPCSLPVEITPLPKGIEVRPVEEKDYRKIFDADSEAFRDHWGYVPPNEKDYQRWLNFPYFDPEIWKVAWEGDQVVGMVRNYVNQEENESLDRKRGYTEFISVRRPWRRMGVARSLLTQSIQMFREMGMEETCLGVDTENPTGALQLYQNVGYEEHHRMVNYRASLSRKTFTAN